MKKINLYLSTAFLLAMFCGLMMTGLSVLARSSSGGEQLMSAKAKNVKIHPKKYLSAEELLVKGKPSPLPDPDEPVDLETYTVGDLGIPLVDGANKYAILIGICDYAESDGSDEYGNIGDICLSDGDALNMNNVLMDVYGYDKDNIVLLRDREAVSSRIIEEIASLFDKTTANDEVVFFYSGHGVTGNYQYDEGDVGENSELVDEGIFTYDRQVIWDDDLAAAFTNLDAARMIFIFDTCEAGGFIDLRGDNRSLVMASGEYETAFVYSTGENGEGLFSHWFVKSGMLDGRADSVDHYGKRKDKDVTVEEAMDYAISKISAQTPAMVDNYAGDLWLAY